MKNKSMVCSQAAELVFKIIILFNSFIFFNFIAGCSKDDDTVNSPGTFNTISGKLTDYLGNGIGNKKIESVTGSTKTASDGSFMFTNIIVPYDITVYMEESNVVTFKNLTTAKPFLSFDYGSTVSFLRTDVTVIFPQLNTNQKAFARFYDSTGVYINEATFSNSTYGQVGISWNGSLSLSGKITLMIYTADNSGNIISYDKYGEKPLTVYNNEPGRIIFHDIDLNTNPVESNITGNLILPSGFQVTDKFIGMSRFPFASLDIYGNFDFNVVFNGSDFSTAVPTLSGNLYHYFLYLNVYNSTDSKNGKKISEILPNNFNYVQFNPFPYLISPVDNAQNINYNTLFTFSKDSPKGLYFAAFEYFVNGYYVTRKIFMDSESFRLSVISDTKLNLQNNTDCQWSVTKISGFNSIDDFVSMPLAKNQKYREILTSETNSFKFNNNK